MSPYTVKQFRQLVADQGKKGNKYNAKRSSYNGVWFDSIKEANYAELLDWRIKSKDIKKWDRQITFDLMVNAKKIAGIRPDFLITNNDGSQEIHEVKSFHASYFLIIDNNFRCSFFIISNSSIAIILQLRGRS